MASPLLAAQARFDSRAAADGSGVLGAMKASAGEPAVADRDWLLALATALQTTLELESLLGLFSTHTAPLVHHDSVEFVGDGALRAITGRAREHRCTYDLVLHDHALGTIAFTRSRPFDAGELAHLEVALANLVHPLRNALLYREALDAAAKDPLTGLSNRSSLEGILEREVELARRHGGAFSLVMLDLDRFKQINDRHGHLVGDRALVELARCVRDQVRESDMVFRYGGEEFCVLLSNTALAGATVLGERIRSAVEAAVIDHDGSPIVLTTSVGVAQLGPGMRGRELIGAADEALYAAKRTGRNRVVAAPA